MSLPRDWEETGGKPQASPERASGSQLLSGERVDFGTGPQFYKRPWYDSVTRRRLLEMIGAMIVIGSLLYIMIPVFTGTAETSRRSVCISHLQRLVKAAKMYEIDNDGLPPTVNWTHSLYDYILDRRGLDALFCPSEEANLPRLKRRRVVHNSSYSYVNPHERRFTGDETTTAVYWDTMGGIGRAAHPGGGNVGYLDGHVRWLPAQRWTAGDLP